MEDLIKREDAIEACDVLPKLYGEAIKIFIKRLPSADRPQGEWIPYEASLNFGDGEGYVIEHKCSACGYLWGEPDYKFCPNCGAQMKGADDEYERAIEQMEHDMLYEPTYNSEDGSM